HILHHCQEQAFRPVPQRVNFLVEQAEKPVPKKLIENGATSPIELLNIKPRIPPSPRKRDSKFRKVLCSFFCR
ncbi:hypothetical protein QUA08_31130, partial [Microcoleus sp. T3B2]|uniref:hypothetical protein n=1 Tax=Microcoleus sp. T3B2 TaxID=3055426 RepID=UPI002FD4C1C7